MSGDIREQLQKQGLNPSATPQRGGEPPGRGRPGSGGPGGSGRGGPPRDDPRSPVPPAPPGGYFDPEGSGPLKLYYVSKSTLDPLVRNFSRDNLKMHQLRRFYNHCARIRRRLQAPGVTWADERVNVVRLTTFSASAAGKQESGIPPSFRSFIDSNVEKIQTQRDFVEGFMKYFEGVVGFSSLYLRDR